MDFFYAPDTCALATHIALEDAGAEYRLHRVSFAKEEQKFWLCLEQKLSFDKGMTLFIDDNLQVLEAAQRYGIKHLLSICKPDSQKPEREINNFHALNTFAEIID